MRQRWRRMWDWRRLRASQCLVGSGSDNLSAGSASPGFHWRNFGWRLVCPPWPPNCKLFVRQYGHFRPYNFRNHPSIGATKHCDCTPLHQIVRRPRAFRASPVFRRGVDHFGRHCLASDNRNFAYSYLPERTIYLFGFEDPHFDIANESCRIVKDQARLRSY